MVLVLSGCTSMAPERTLSTVEPKYASLPNGMSPIQPDQPSIMTRAMQAQGIKNLVRHIESKKGRSLNVLSLSGGGQNGAFGAGFLVGWTETGKRPQFDAVGGVSTGALLATHALLGTPADDAKLQEMYTTITKSNIYNKRGLLTILESDSLRDTAPLRALISQYITTETLQRVAAAYDDDRYLFVGTTNVDYGTTWVWNMTEIARDGELELYRKVLLASASFPIVFPPQEIYGHLFVDGAARSNLVVPGMAGGGVPPPPLHGPGNLYLINNGKEDHAPEALRRALGPVAATTVGVMMDHSMQTGLMRSYFGVRVLGYNFNLVGIEPGVNIGTDPLAFDPVQMRAAFDAGRTQAKEPEPWASEPPSVGDLPPWALDALKRQL